MSHVSHEVTINVAPEQVFVVLLDVEHAPEWMANLEQVRNVTGRSVGDSFDWTFRMTGLTFKGKTVFAIVVPGQRLREEGSGDLTNAWDWQLSATGDGKTLVKVDIDYVVPGGELIGGMLNKLFVERQNDKDLLQSLANLKQRLESK